MDYYKKENYALITQAYNFEQKLLTNPIHQNLLINYKRTIRQVLTLIEALEA